VRLQPSRLVVSARSRELLSKCRCPFVTRCLRQLLFHAAPCNCIVEDKRLHAEVGATTFSARLSTANQANNFLLECCCLLKGVPGTQWMGAYPDMAPVALDIWTHCIIQGYDVHELSRSWHPLAAFYANSARRASPLLGTICFATGPACIAALEDSSSMLLRLLAPPGESQLQRGRRLGRGGPCRSAAAAACRLVPHPIRRSHMTPKMHFGCMSKSGCVVFTLSTQKCMRGQSLIAD
jgi:hypothetical protein